MFYVGARAFYHAFYGEGTGEILFYNLECSPEDIHLDNCTKFDLPSLSSCLHFEDAGVQCNALCTDGVVRLADGENENEGHVELCKDGIWGTICDPSGDWGEAESRVVCCQLNLPYTGKIICCISSFLPFFLNNLLSYIVIAL